MGQPRPGICRGKRLRNGALVAAGKVLVNLAQGATPHNVGAAVGHHAGSFAQRIDTGYDLQWDSEGVRLNDGESNGDTAALAYPYVVPRADGGAVVQDAADGLARPQRLPPCSRRPARRPPL